MRQVPKYLIIGAGRMAKHFIHYFQGLNISFLHWSRVTHTSRDLESFVHQSTHILLLISDSQIELFIRRHPFMDNKIIIHCSGCLSTSLAYSAHPLYTFGEKPYELSEYQKIPFITEKNTLRFEQLFPDLPNPSYQITEYEKPLYHALCVLGGNFTTLLWQKCFNAFQQLQLPKETIVPYLNKIIENVINETETALTGPLVRNDQQTINQNLAALHLDPFQQVYQAFVNAYAQMNQEKINENS